MFKKIGSASYLKFNKSIKFIVLSNNFNACQKGKEKCMTIYGGAIFFKRILWHE